MKKLFNNTWFKCISVLLVLAVVLGGTLAILNDVLYVSASERTSRAIKKIYGTEITDYEIQLDVDDTTRKDSPIICKNNDDVEIGEIRKIYIVGTDMLFQTSGYNGYKGGTITLWIKVISNDSNNLLIDKIVLSGYEKQTLMSKFDGSYYENFYVDVTEAYKNGQLFTTNSNDQLSNPNAGATKSANAMVGAVNCVIQYLGGKN